MDPFVAVIVAVSPVVPPETLSVGVVSLVTLSVFDAPVSDDASRSGADGADGRLPPDDEGALLVGASMNMLSGGLLADVFPVGSVSVAVTLHVPSVSAAKSHVLAEPTV